MLARAKRGNGEIGEGNGDGNVDAGNPFHRKQLNGHIVKYNIVGLNTE
jgi:hypothetical protein